MRVAVGQVESTLCFVGTEERPLQLVRVYLADLAGAADGRVSVTVAARDGGSITTPVPASVEVTGPDPIPATVVEVAVAGGHQYHAPGTTVPVTVEVSDGRDTHAAGATVVVAEPGWTMWMVPHFHYDPVWWNTQAAYAERWDALPDAQGVRSAFQQDVFTLVRAYLDAAREDPDFRFVLAEVDYLKPYWDACPQDREYLRRLLREGRLEIVGGTYNEPNTNLTGPESTARNAVYGAGFQRGVLGADPDTAWQLDAFGHDPQFPGMMRDAGLTTSSWARGPFHQWGPVLNPGGERGDPRRMQFPSEFRWISPSGRGLVTSYMTDHYSIGYWMDSAATLAEAREQVYTTFRELAQVAATRNVLLPVGTDHAMPNRWVTEIARDWASRYVWPRFVCATPREYFAAVRAGSDGGAALLPQTRDMNPVYTGKDVSYIDVKQAQRATENLLLAGERFATLAGLVAGASYPDAAVDRAWRLLVFGAHHDGITGTFSDQVYLDLLAGWREAYDLARTVHDEALDALVSCVDVPDAVAATGGQALVVFNALSWPRTDLARIRVEFPAPGVPAVAVLDPGGARVPAVAEAVERHRDGTLAAATLTFLARDVPGVGYATYTVTLDAGPLPEWTPIRGATGAACDAFSLVVDPARGGGIASLVDRTTGRELVRPGEVSELRLYDEHSAHPTFGEGPWHLLPNGVVRTSAGCEADVTVESSPLGQRVTARGRLGSLTYATTLLLADGTERVGMRTVVDGFTGTDQLLRVRLPCDLPGALPVSEVGYATVGRGFGFPDVDTAAQPWTLDNPAYTWFGLGSTATVHVGPVVRAVGVAEVVVPGAVASSGGADALVTALVRAGVTSTCSTPERERYGALDVDSNLPDVRISAGGPDENAFTRRVLEAADPGYAAELARRLADSPTARLWVPADRALGEVWVPGADLRGARDLPVLVVAGRDAAATAAAVAALAADLADARVDVDAVPGLPAAPPGEPPAPGHTVAVLDRGIPGFVVGTDGGLHLSLFRSCTGWPSGVWIDPPRRATPDGSGFQLQHWSHAFDYALVAGPGDWRDIRAVQHGWSFDNPFAVRPAAPAPRPAGTGRPLPPRAALVEVRPDTVVLGALKPAGTPLASGSALPADPRAGVTLRLFESVGRTATAEVGGLVELGGFARTDLLEAPSRPEDDALHLVGADVATVLARPRPSIKDDNQGVVGSPPVPAVERAQPIFARYWLHGTGPAPTGNMPLAVHVHPREVEAAAGAPFTVRASAASDLTGAEHDAVVRVAVPEGWSAEPTERPVRLGPGASVGFDVTVRPAGGTRAGTYLVALRASAPDGQVVEDLTTVHVGPGRHRRPYGAEVTVGVDASGLVLPPGGVASVPVELRSHLDSAVHGEARVVSPWGTWDAVFAATAGGGPSAVCGFTLPARGRHSVPFVVRVPPDAAPGSWWLLVKVAYAGRVAYSSTVPLEVVRP